MIDEKLLAMLACPVCKAPLQAGDQSLICSKTQVRYPVEDGIPILLADRAEPQHPDEGQQRPPQQQ